MEKRKKIRRQKRKGGRERGNRRNVEGKEKASSFSSSSSSSLSISSCCCHRRRRRRHRAFGAGSFLLPFPWRRRAALYQTDGRKGALSLSLSPLPPPSAARWKATLPTGKALLGDPGMDSYALYVRGESSGGGVGLVAKTGGERELSKEKPRPNALAGGRRGGW